MRDFLKGLELDDETIDTIMSEHNKLVTKDKEEIITLKKQVDDANKEIQSYKDMDIDSIKQYASDWEEKYNKLISEQEEVKKEGIRKEIVDAFFSDIANPSFSATPTAPNNTMATDEIRKAMGLST